VKIWGGRGGGNPVRVAIFLAEKGIDVPFEPVDLMGGAHRETAFLAKNPTAQVPVLELDDGTCISETTAICRYFERLHPTPPLMGQGALDEAVVEMWQRRIEFGMYAAAREALRHSAPFLRGLEPVQVPEWADINRGRIPSALQLLDQQLQQHRFVAGASFTIADITGVLGFQIFGMLQYALPEEFAGVARWRAELFARPSVISAIGQPKG
jgi:glutathione S-transferase